MDDSDLSQLLNELCDHAQDRERTMDPLPDEVVTPLRALAERLRRQHVEAHEREHTFGGVDTPPMSYFPTAFANGI